MRATSRPRSSSWPTAWTGSPPNSRRASSWNSPSSRRVYSARSSLAITEEVSYEPRPIGEALRAGTDPPAQGAQRDARLRGGPQRHPAPERGARGGVVVRDRAARGARGGGAGAGPAQRRGPREDELRREPGDAGAGVGRARLAGR